MKSITSIIILGVGCALIQQKYHNLYVGNRFSSGRISVTDIEVNDEQVDRPMSGVSISSQASVYIISIEEC